MQHRKNLPSLDTERQTKIGSRSKNRGNSSDVKMAVQINNQQPSRDDS